MANPYKKFIIILLKEVQQDVYRVHTEGPVLSKTMQEPAPGWWHRGVKCREGGKMRGGDAKCGGVGNDAKEISAALKIKTT